MFRKTSLRILALLTLLLAAGLAGGQERPADREAWIERLTDLQSNSPESLRTIQEFSALDPALGFGLLQETWKNLSGVDSKIFLLNNLGDHLRILDVLHLGATDPSLVVQNRALQILENYSFQNFCRRL